MSEDSLAALERLYGYPSSGKVDRPLDWHDQDVIDLIVAYRAAVAENARLRLVAGFAAEYRRESKKPLDQVPDCDVQWDLVQYLGRRVDDALRDACHSIEVTK